MSARRSRRREIKERNAQLNLRRRAGNENQNPDHAENGPPEREIEMAKAVKEQRGKTSKEANGRVIPKEPAKDETGRREFNARAAPMNIQQA